MAAGDVHVIAKGIENNANHSGGLWTNTLKMAIITNAVTPAVTDSDPRWGSGGSQNYSTAEVTPGGNYTAGGITLTSPTLALSSANINHDITSPISLAANASNPTGAYWGIVYDSTSAGLEVLAYIDLGGPISLVSGLQLNVDGSSTGTQILLQGTAT